MDFCRHKQPCTQVNSQVTDIEKVTSYKYLTNLSRRPATFWDVASCTLLDSMQVVGESRMMDKLSSLLVQESHPLQDTISALGSSGPSFLLLSDCTTNTAPSSIHLHTFFICTHIFIITCKYTATLLCSYVYRSLFFLFYFLPF